MNVPPIVKYRTLAIAKSEAPIDTGNLRHNAIKMSRNKPDRWTIKYSTSDAYYVEILEDATLDGKVVKGREPRKFISRTSLIIAKYLKDYYAGKPVSGWARNRLRYVLKSSEDSDERKARLFESQHKLGKIRWR